MERLLSGLLILMTLWMSTWLVTDIHVVHAADSHAYHPLFTAKPAPDSLAPDQEHGKDDGCHFCSYDHGGHVGGMAVPTDFIVTIPPPSQTYFPPYQPRVSPLSHPPRHRPPIV